MTTKPLPLIAGFGFVMSLLCPVLISTASGQTDSWSDNSRGTFFKWETASEWSLGVTPSLAQTDVMITNRFVGSGIFARTVSIDATTVLSNAINGCMSINNLTMSSPSATLNNELFVSNTGATPLTIDHSLTISSHGVVSITNSVVNVGTAGGTLSIDGSLLLNTGTLDTGGVMGSDTSIVGNTAVGQMTVLDGTWLAGTVLVGSAAGSQGTLTVAGGTSVVSSGLTIGTPDCTGTGTFAMTGGQVFITNVFGSATLDVESGTFSLSGGLLQVDKIIMTNPCSHFSRSGGTLVYGSAVLDPNRDDDGDGIPNGYEQSYGLDPLNAENATKDTDGDGMSDLAEYIAGTDPTNSTSVFRITSVVRTNNNMRITWTTVGGRTNRVYVDTGAADGSFNGVFGNLSPFIIISGTGPTATNYTDVGGATNVPARYYRVRIIP